MSEHVVVVLGLLELLVGRRPDDPLVELPPVVVECADDPVHLAANADLVPLAVDLDELVDRVVEHALENGDDVFPELRGDRLLAEDVLVDRVDLVLGLALDGQVNGLVPVAVVFLPFLPFLPTTPGAVPVTAGTGWPWAVMVRPKTTPKKTRPTRARERRKGDIVRPRAAGGPREWWNRDYPGRPRPPTREKPIMLRGRSSAGPVTNDRTAGMPIVVDERRGRG